jgi:hypothetical protein
MVSSGRSSYLGARDNQRSISCIPAGEYELRRTIYNKHGYETFEVTGVPNRTRILIHPGNTEEDVMGCIAVGLKRGYLERKDEDTGKIHSKRAILESRQAFKHFMAHLQGDNVARLVIEWAPGLP